MLPFGVVGAPDQFSLFNTTVPISLGMGVPSFLLPLIVMVMVPDISASERHDRGYGHSQVLAALGWRHRQVTHSRASPAPAGAQGERPAPNNARCGALVCWRSPRCGAKPGHGQARDPVRL